MSRNQKSQIQGQQPWNVHSTGRFMYAIHWPDLLLIWRLPRYILARLSYRRCNAIASARSHALPASRLPTSLVRVHEQLVKFKTEILKKVVSAKVEIGNISVSIIEIEDGMGNAVVELHLHGWLAVY